MSKPWGRGNLENPFNSAHATVAYSLCIDQLRVVFKKLSMLPWFCIQREFKENYNLNLIFFSSFPLLDSKEITNNKEFENR